MASIKVPALPGWSEACFKSWASVATGSARIVVDAPEDLVEIGLLLIPPGLKRQDRHIVRGSLCLDPVPRLRFRLGFDGVGVGWDWGTDHDHLGLEVPQAEPLDVGEPAVGIDLQPGRDHLRVLPIPSPICFAGFASPAATWSASRRDVGPSPCSIVSIRRRRSRLSPE